LVDMLKSCLLIITICLSMSCSVNSAFAEHNPPFELSGVVRSVSTESLEIYLPYINKQVNVTVNNATIISNRLQDNELDCKISEITEEDLIVVKGVLSQGSFLSTEISFLPN